jgi:hypothetical protein
MREYEFELPCLNAFVSSFGRDFDGELNVLISRFQSRHRANDASKDVSSELDTVCNRLIGISFDRATNSTALY